MKPIQSTITKWTFYRINFETSYFSPYSTSVFGVNKWVKPRDTRQQLFRITPAVWPDPVSAKDGRVRVM